MPPKYVRLGQCFDKEYKLLPVLLAHWPALRFWQALQINPPTRKSDSENEPLSSISNSVCASVMHHIKVQSRLGFLYCSSAVQMRQAKCVDEFFQGFIRSSGKESKLFPSIQPNNNMFIHYQITLSFRNFLVALATASKNRFHSSFCSSSRQRW